MQAHRLLQAHKDDQDIVQRTELTIGQVARLTGINAKTIRYYESVGLLPRPSRSINHYRRYTIVDVNRLNLLRRIRLLDVPLSAAKPLLIGASDARCIDVQQEMLRLVRQRLVALDQQIDELHLLRDELERCQDTLVNCHPDESESFSACRDMSCIAFSRER